MVSDRKKAKQGIVARDQSDPDLAQTLVEGKKAELAAQKEANSHKKFEMGIIGWLFGGTENISRNIAGVVIIASMIFIAFGYFSPPLGQTNSGEIIRSLFALITLAFGYLAGKANNN